MQMGVEQPRQEMQQLGSNRAKRRGNWNSTLKTSHAAPCQLRGGTYSQGLWVPGPVGMCVVSSISSLASI